MERLAEMLQDTLNELIPSMSQIEQDRIDKAINRFKSYEDTGLTPEEITAVCRCRECVKYHTEDCPMAEREFIGPEDEKRTLFTANYKDGFCNYGVRREGVSENKNQ